MGKSWERTSSCHDHEYAITNCTAAISRFPRLFLSGDHPGHDTNFFIPHVHHPWTENGFENRFVIVILPESLHVQVIHDKIKQIITTQIQENSTKFVVKRDLLNARQICGHRFGCLCSTISFAKISLLFFSISSSHGHATFQNIYTCKYMYIVI